VNQESEASQKNECFASFPGDSVEPIRDPSTPLDLKQDSLDRLKNQVNLHSYVFTCRYIFNNVLLV